MRIEYELPGRREETVQIQYEPMTIGGWVHLVVWLPVVAVLAAWAIVSAIGE